MMAVAFGQKTFVSRICGFAMLLAASGCGQKQQTTQWRNLTSKDEIEVAVKVNDGSTNYVISYQNGRLVFDIMDGSLGMTVQEREGVTMRLNPTNQRLSSIMITRISDTGEERIMDYNADGMPDKKISGSPPKPFIFFDGVFYPALEENSRHFIMRTNGNLEVRFNGNCWQPLKDTIPIIDSR